MKTDRTQQIVCGNFISHQTTFHQKGDSVVFTIPPFHRSTYPVRHVVVSGSLKAEFPNTEMGSEPRFLGDVWPLSHDYPVNKFTVTALEDNSSYYCVAYNGRRVDLQTEDNVLVLPGNEVIIPENSMLFVFGEDYIINDAEYEENNVFTTTNKPITLKARSLELKYTRVYINEKENENG